MNVKSEKSISEGSILRINKPHSFTAEQLTGVDVKTPPVNP